MCQEYIYVKETFIMHTQSKFSFVRLATLCSNADNAAAA